MLCKQNIVLLLIDDKGNWKKAYRGETTIGDPPKAGLTSIMKQRQNRGMRYAMPNV